MPLAIPAESPVSLTLLKLLQSATGESREREGGGEGEERGKEGGSVNLHDGKHVCMERHFTFISIS